MTTKKKRQHYVPRFYLKNFSNDEKFIYIYNLNNNKVILRAPLKNQCNEDYFYSKESVIEDALSGIESLAATIIRTIIVSRTVPPVMSVSHEVLVYFTSLQQGRTKHAADANDEAFDFFHKSILRNTSKFKDSPFDDFRIVNENPTYLPLSTYLLASPLAMDLRIKIIINNSKEPFITSDNPVVMYNQYMEHFTTASTNGLASKGLEIFFPVSPQILLLFYDNEIYRIGSNKTDIIEITSLEEVRRINKLQWLNAHDNVYFSTESETESIKQQSELFQPERIAKIPRMVAYKKLCPSPGYTSESVYQVSNHQLRTQLQLSFISIRESKRKIPLENRRPNVRNPLLLSKFNEYEKLFKAAAGNYDGGDFWEYLEMNP